MMEYQFRRCELSQSICDSMSPSIRARNLQLSCALASIGEIEHTHGVHFKTKPPLQFQQPKCRKRTWKSVWRCVISVRVINAHPFWWLQPTRHNQDHKLFIYFAICLLFQLFRRRRLLPRCRNWQKGWNVCKRFCLSQSPNSLHNHNHFRYTGWGNVISMQRFPRKTQSIVKSFDRPRRQKSKF